MGDGGQAIRVGIAYPFGSEAIETFHAVSSRLRITTTDRDDQIGIDAIAADDLDGLIGATLPTDRTSTPSLRWLQVLSAGVEYLVGPGHVWPAEVVLTNARGAFATTIGQYTMAAILRVAERADLRQGQQRARLWRGIPKQAMMGIPIRGQTIVIVGYGGIGREIARLASAHGMRVLAVKADPDRRSYDGYQAPGTGDPDGSIPERIVGVGRLGEIVGEADYLSVTLPITEESRGVVSRDVIAGLRDHAWVINTGRGPVIDEGALAQALTAGLIGGAVLDVFSVEPLPAEVPSGISRTWCSRHTCSEPPSTRWRNSLRPISTGSCRGAPPESRGSRAGYQGPAYP